MVVERVIHYAWGRRRRHAINAHTGMSMMANHDCTEQTTTGVEDNLAISDRDLRYEVGHFF
jgi:hypothetical protein